MEHTLPQGRPLTAAQWMKDGKAIMQLRRLRFCQADDDATVRIIQAKIYAGGLRGVEAARATPQQSATLAAAVIDMFRSKNKIHNADRFFASMAKTRNELDPVAQILSRRVLQIRRASCKRNDAKERFNATLLKYAI